jgi:hypothetical protein
VRDTGRQDVVEGGNAIGGYKEEAVGVEAVDVADFAAGVKLEFRKFCAQQDRVKEFGAHAENSTGKKRRVF